VAGFDSAQSVIGEFQFHRKPAFLVFACILLAMAWVNPSFGASIRDAIKGGDVEKVKALLAVDPSIASKKDSDGFTPLHYVAQHGSKSLAQLLIGHRPDVDARDELGAAAPLHYAASYGQRDVAEILLANGANPNARDKNGAAPLHYAAPFGQVEIVTLLLANKAEASATTKEGRTPLHGAANGGHDGVVGVAKALLAAGADIDARDDEGSTPLRLAQQAGQTEMKTMLLASGASRNTKNYAEIEDDKIREKMISCRGEAVSLGEVRREIDSEDEWLDENSITRNNNEIDEYNGHVRRARSLSARYNERLAKLKRDCNGVSAKSSIVREVCGGGRDLFCKGFNQTR
jgi:cytohesin